MTASIEQQLSPGAVLGRYQLVRRLGAGGMGEVFEARHLDLGKAVALKTLHGGASTRPDVLARFVREGQAAARLRHPNAVDVTDVGVVNGVAYLVMEMLHGEDLQGLLKRERVLSPARIAAILLPTLSALAAAHEEGIVHRDLKPANIFLHRARDGSLVPKVLDFGISKMHVEESPALTATSAVLGTPSYMSPEQLRSTRDVDLRSDLYSLGVVLYECATGALPFVGETLFAIMTAVDQGVYTPPRKVRGDIPEALERVIVRAMSRAPAHRFGSAQELAQALAPFADADPGAWQARASAPSMPPVTVLSSPSVPALSASINTLTGNTGSKAAVEPPGPQRRWPALAVGAALLAVVSVGSLWALSPGSSPAATHAPTATVAAPPAAPPAPRVPALRHLPQRPQWLHPRQLHPRPLHPRWPHPCPPRRPPHRRTKPDAPSPTRPPRAPPGGDAGADAADGANRVIWWRFRWRLRAPRVPPATQ